jgi:hypothetical protein
MDDLALSFKEKFKPHETQTGSGAQSSLSNMAVPGGGPQPLPPGQGPVPTPPSPKNGLFVGDEKQKEWTEKQEIAVKRIIDLDKSKWYDILNAPDNCTTAEAHTQYKAQCLLVHPDHNRHPDAHAAFISRY